MRGVAVLALLLLAGCTTPDEDPAVRPITEPLVLLAMENATDQNLSLEIGLRQGDHLFDHSNVTIPAQLSTTRVFKMGLDRVFVGVSVLDPMGVQNETDPAWANAAAALNMTGSPQIAASYDPRDCLFDQGFRMLVRAEMVDGNLTLTRTFGACLDLSG